MNKYIEILIFVIGISVIGSSEEVYAQKPTNYVDYQEIGISIIRRINGEEPKSDLNYTSAMKKIMEEYGRDNYFRYYRNKFGKITACSPPSMLPCIALFQITAEHGRWTMIVGFDTDGSVSALQFDVPTVDAPELERNTTPLRLPFREEWFVEMGGSRPEQNYHIGLGARDIRRAVDFAVLDSMGRPFKDAGKKNEDYFSFGKDILAVADGEVVVVIDGTPDNRPLTTNPMSVAGNAIIVKHKDNEYSRYCHLKINSTRVKPGQKVVSGQVIAQCGNSGNTAFPHLHFDYTNTDVASGATGVLPFFQNVAVRRGGVEFFPLEYTPLRNESVRPRH